MGTTQGYFRGLIEEWSPSCNLTIHSTLPLRQEVQANVIKCRDKRSGMTLSITIQKTGFNDLRNRGSECGGRLQSRKAQSGQPGQLGKLLGPSVTSRGETSSHLLVKTTPGFLFIVQEIGVKPSKNYQAVSGSSQMEAGYQLLSAIALSDIFYIVDIDIASCFFIH